MDKKIGIITMHKVLNYGSALQAYALQETIGKLGLACELIDYIPPKKKRKGSFLKKIIGLYHSFYANIKHEKFQNFYENRFLLSPNRYNDSTTLHKNPPKYDIYVTGSDQVWNIKHVGHDTSFLLSFAPEFSKKISYASSLAMPNIPQEYIETYRKYLSRYDAISTREEKGAQMVKELIGKHIDVTLDPTFLLNKSEWIDFAKKSNINIGKPYMLVYILDYAYNPYPYVTKLIKNIQRKMGLHIVLLNFSNKEFLGFKNITNLHDAVSPEDFVKLFQDASLILTTSFHGVAYSLNLSKPFYAILDNTSNGDDRMHNILLQLGAEDRLIRKGDEFPEISLEMEYQQIQDTLEKSRKQSKDFLLNNLMK